MDFKELAQVKDIRLTPARKNILLVLANAQKPLCYKEVLALSKDNMDKATFYRAMIHFEEIGLLNKLESTDRKWYYELKDKEKHAHFICEICNQISCLDFFPKDIKAKKVTNILVKGTCEECNE